MTFIWSIIGFIIAMGLLVTIHEWGHYMVARLFNIKVTHFSIGFGKPVYVKQKGETQFQIGSIPLGGYVKFADEREGRVPQEDMTRTFNRQSVYRRFAVVSAGPIVNLIFAWIAFSLIYFSGVTGLKPVFEEATSGSVLAKSLSNNDQAWQVKRVDGEVVLDWKDVYHRVLEALVDKQHAVEVELASFDGQMSKKVFLPLSELDINTPKQKWLSVLGFKPKYPQMPPVIDQVLPQSPADKLGLEKGDLIVTIDELSISDWNQFVSYVQKHPNEVIQLSFERNGRLIQKQTRLDEKEFNGQVVGSLGASVFWDEAQLESYKVSVSYGVLESIQKGWTHSLGLLDMTVNMIKRMIFGDVSIKNLSGPVSIAEFSGQALQNGWVAFLSLLGLLSLSLGVLNLLPIPVLDGGHLFFCVIEMIKGAPVKESIELVAQKIGVTLILMLTFFALFNDVVRISNG